MPAKQSKISQKILNFCSRVNFLQMQHEEPLERIKSDASICICHDVVIYKTIFISFIYLLSHEYETDSNNVMEHIPWDYK